MKVFLFMLLFPFVVACSQGPEYTTQKLPNGKELKIISIGKMYSSTEGQDDFLLLRYESDFDISDKQSIKKEIDEIWPVFRVNVEKENFGAAVIQASNTVKTSFMSTSAKNYGVVYEKGDDGVWKSKM